MVKEKQPKEKIVKKPTETQNKGVQPSKETVDSPNKKPEVESPVTIVKEVIKEVFIEKPQKPKQKRKPQKVEQPEIIQEIKKPSNVNKAALVLGIVIGSVGLYLLYTKLKSKLSPEQKALEDIRSGKITGLQNVHRIE